MKKILILILSMALTLPFVFCGCTPTPTDVIRLSEVTHSIFYAPQYLALALGYFDDFGIEIELTNAGGADNVMTSLISGEADIGLMGCEQAIYVHNQGMQNAPVVIGQLTKRDGSFLVARTPIDNFDWQNLENSEILMGRRGGMPAMILQYILNNCGYVNGENITMNYDIQFNMLAPAFTGGTADFVPLFEPTASQLVMEGKGYIVAPIGQMSGEIPYTVYYVTHDYLENNPERVENFLRAVQKGCDYLFAHDNQHLAELLLPYFDGTTKELIQSALANYKACDVWMRNPVMLQSTFERLQDLMENAGELTERVNFYDVVDNSIANKLI